jgi:hypothetical protein
MAENAAPTPPPLTTGRFEGRRAFVDLVRHALDTAAREAWPSLVLSDADFLDWPLGESAVVDALSLWASRGRQIRLLARDFGPVRLTHPRLVQWRTTWGHRVEAHACPGATGSELPSAIWSPGWTLERLDPLRCTGVASNDPGRRIALKERLDACWHKGAPSFAATTLGL